MRYEEDIVYVIDPDEAVHDALATLLSTGGTRVGDAAVVANDDMDFEGDPTRDYTVFGVDASYQWKNLDLRGEYISQDVADEATCIACNGADGKGGNPSLTEADIRAVLAYLRAAFGS